MKKFTLTLVFAFIAMVSYSQIEVKINPLSLLWSSFDISAEYGVNEKIGVDFAPLFDFGKTKYNDLEYKNSKIGLVVNPRFYFNPNRGIDKFYFGAYVKFASGKSTYDDDTYLKNTRLALGPNIGYKVSSDSGFIFDIGFGVGKALVNNWDSDIAGFDEDLLSLFSIDFIGKLAVGYRF